MKCPYCNIDKPPQRMETRDMTDGRTYRRNLCPSCGKRYNTIEAYVPDGQEPVLHMFRRYPAKVIYKPKPESKPVALIKRRV